MTLTSIFLTYMMPFLTSTAGNETLEGLLENATKVVTWIITTMGSYVTFIIGHPIVMVGFIITLAGVGIGFFLRIFRSM